MKAPAPGTPRTSGTLHAKRTRTVTLTVIGIVVIVAWLTGCSSMSTGTITGGHTELERHVDTAGPRHYTQHERIIRINPPGPGSPPGSPGSPAPAR